MQHNKPDRLVPGRNLLLLLAAGMAVAAAIWYVCLRSNGEDIIEKRINKYAGIIGRYAGARGLPKELVRAIIRAESSGIETAVSEAGAKGLMQITPVTEEELMRRFDIPPGDLFDPEYNIRCGTLYLRYLLDRFDEDLLMALAAYHAGPTRMRALQREHPDISSSELVARFAPPSTRAYCKKILGVGQRGFLSGGQR